MTTIAIVEVLTRQLDDAQQSLRDASLEKHVGNVALQDDSSLENNLSIRVSSDQIRYTGFHRAEVEEVTILSVQETTTAKVNELLSELNSKAKKSGFRPAPLVGT